MIPRRIIRTNRSAHIFAPAVPRCEAALMALMPDYEHVFFDDFTAREFVRQRRLALLPLYDSFPRNVQRADLFRMLAVAELGGYYLDMDVFLFRRLDEFCGASLVFPFECTFTPEIYLQRHRCDHTSEEDLLQLGNYGFGVTAGHWFLEEVIGEIQARSDDLTSRTHPVDVLWSTGPDCLNAVRQRHRERLQGDLHVLRGIPLPDDLESCGKEPSDWDDWYHFGTCGTHLMTNTWVARW